MILSMTPISIKSAIDFYIPLQQNHSKTYLYYERKEHYF